MKTMTRYSRTNEGKPKNTLFTVKENGVIYFGIARCNTNKDTMSKKMGRKISSGRAALAHEIHLGHNPEGLVVDETGLSGYCSEENIYDLLAHFESIDDWIDVSFEEDLAPEGWDANGTYIPDEFELALS